MSKKSLFRCNVSLAIATPFIIIGSILLECLHGRSFWGLPIRTWIWIHILTAAGFSLLVLRHLFLHRNPCGSPAGTARSLTRNKLTRILLRLSAGTLLSGMAAIPSFLNGRHTPVGGVHGVVGLITLGVMLLHIAKRRTWFAKRPDGNAFVPQIDDSRCIRCGLCVKRCPAQLFSSNGGRITVSDPTYCLQCRKCLHHCPRQAISPKR